MGRRLRPSLDNQQTVVKITPGRPQCQPAAEWEGPVEIPTPNPVAPWVRAGWLPGLSVLPKTDPNREGSWGFARIQEEPEFDACVAFALGHCWRGRGLGPSERINRSNGMNQVCWNLAQVGGIGTLLDAERRSAKESCPLGPELGGTCARTRSLWTQAGSLSQQP